MMCLLELAKTLWKQHKSLRVLSLYQEQSLEAVRGSTVDLFL